MRRRLGTALVTVLALVALAACGGGDLPAPTPDPAAAAVTFPMTVENCDRSPITFDAPPQRVMAIGQDAATLLWAAGAVDRISTYAPQPGDKLGPAEADVAKRPTLQVSKAADLSREAIIAEAPDLVVSFGLNQTSFEDLDAVGIKSLYVTTFCDDSGAPQPSRQVSPFDAIYGDIELYGKLLGDPDRAAASVADLRKRVAAVQPQAGGAAGKAPAAALFVRGTSKPLGGYGNRSTIHQQLELLGLTNVFAGTDARLFDPSIETLIAAKPEVLIALYSSPTTEQEARDALTALPELAPVPAIVNKKVLALDFDYTGGGILAVDGLEKLAEQLTDGQ